MAEIKERIIEAKGLIGDSAIHTIVDALNIQGWDDRIKAGKCPFHTNGGTVENTPSFKWYDADNAFKCFGCGARYGIYDYYKSITSTTKKALDMLFEESGIDFKLNKDYNKDYIFPKPESPDNDMSTTIAYLSKRKISESTIRNYGVKEDGKGNMVFEFYDEQDKLMLVKYRPARKLKKGEVKTWGQKGANTTPLLWGMNLVSFDKPLIITEGEIDRLSVLEAGTLNVVSVPFGSNNHNWIEENWDFLDMFEEFIICSDNDSAGRKMSDDIIPRLGSGKCKTVNYPVNPKGTPCVDLNEVLFYYGTELVNGIIENAKDVPIKNVINLADVEDVDLSKAIGMKTGLKSIDRKLGKFFLGTVDVITGVNGSGKSTFINQACVVEPLEQGFKTFIFSGELAPPQLKNWLEYPMAGKKYIDEIKLADDQPTYYKVSKECKQDIRDWYNGKIYLYDDELDKSSTSLLNKMEIMARKYGVKNFLIDNLLTVDIDELEGASVWDKQKTFMKELVRFAIRYEVVVHLVAHPRKLDFVKRLSKMDVSGSGDITNLAHYVVAIHRVTNEEKHNAEENGEPVYDAIVDLFKNRPIGFQDVSFGLYFDTASKRFYKDDTEQFKEYSWTKDKPQEDLTYDGVF